MMETNASILEPRVDGGKQGQEEVERYEVTLGDLFHEGFLSRYTKVRDIGEFFQSGRFDPRSLSDIMGLEKETLNAHIQEVTVFQDFDEMLNRAVSELFVTMINA